MRFLNTVMFTIVLGTPFVLASALLAGGPVLAIKAVLVTYAFGIGALCSYAALCAFTGRD